MRRSRGHGGYRDMDNMIAYCGLFCGSCPIHLATLEPDENIRQTMRESISGQCYQQYGIILKPEEVNDCDGCRADTGRIFSGCMNCQIRECAIRKQIESCAYCADYTCDKLMKHFSVYPDAQSRLDEQKRGLSIENQHFR